jgi:hypothetical protein
MTKNILIFLFLISPFCNYAQTYEKEFETLFAWEVKQIDEFIERFNDSESTLIKKYNEKHNSSAKLTREKIIKSLFNASQKDWNFQEISSFIQQVDNPEDPEYLDFNNDNWLATVNCAVVFKGKAQTAILKLKIKNLSDGSCKWEIIDVAAGFLSPLGVNKGSDLKQPIIPKAINTSDYLTPISNTNDFMDIDMVSENPINISNYITKSNQYNPNMCSFITQCLNKELKILHVNTVTYNFFQIKGWEIIVKKYNRETKNSGWLISKLIKKTSS